MNIYIYVYIYYAASDWKYLIEIGMPDMETELSFIPLRQYLPLL